MNYRLTSRIYSQIGTLYLYQEVYDKAHDVFVKAYQYAILAKDSISITYSLSDEHLVHWARQTVLYTTTKRQIN